jgi:hypothetical protein
MPVIAVAERALLDVAERALLRVWASVGIAATEETGGGLHLAVTDPLR